MTHLFRFFSNAAPDTQSRISFALLSGILIFYPTSLKICSLMIIAFSIHWIFWLRFRIFHQFRQNGLLLTPFLLLFLLYAISLLYSDNIKEGFFNIEKRLSLFILPVIVGTLPFKIDGKKLFWVAVTSAISGMMLSLILAIQNVPAMGLRAFYWAFLTDTITFHPTYFSLFISFIIFWGFHLFGTDWKKFSGRLRFFILFLFLFFIIYLILLASKLQLLLFFFTLVIYAYKNRGMMNRFTWAVLIFIYFGSAIFGYNTILKERIKNISTLKYKLDDPVQTFNELTIRLALTECSWEVINHSIVWGVGAGDGYDELDKVYRKYDYKFGYLDHQDPHNEYLNTWVNVGLFGVFILIGIFLIGLFQSIVQRNYLFTLFISFFMINCLFESMLSQQKGVVFFGLFFPILSIHFLKKMESDKPFSNQR